VGSRDVALGKLETIRPQSYVRTRNFYDGDVTRLSPYISHRLVWLTEVYDAAITKTDNPTKIEKFIQELAWREFWQHVLAHSPELAWTDAEAYKTGFDRSDYADKLPEDIRKGETELASINHFIRDLLDTGYMHNHTRMYLASYIVHFRRVKWQVGAQWFLSHLLDADIASNNLSWQWVASTFSHKPYIFNLENVQKYCGDSVNCLPEDNSIIDASYDELSNRLFPNK
jgi:deoxyribodipyrimidine photo-lyase